MATTSAGDSTTQSCAKSRLVEAQIAHKFALGQHAAAFAMTDAVERFSQGPAQRLAAVAIALQQIERHALRRFRTDAGQTTQ